MTPHGSAAILLAREECPYYWPNILARSRDMGKTMIFLDPTNRRLWDAPSPAGVPRILRDQRSARLREIVRTWFVLSVWLTNVSLVLTISHGRAVAARAIATSFLPCRDHN